uniref:Uncharacterized protein n=1 Tax=Rhizophora mucronata TaxID=61149 RepID=A0A2P2QTB1_RHIMU
MFHPYFLIRPKHMLHSHKFSLNLTKLRKKSARESNERPRNKNNAPRRKCFFGK